MPSMVVLNIETGASDVPDSWSALPCPSVRRHTFGPSMAALGAAAPC